MSRLIASCCAGAAVLMLLLGTSDACAQTQDEPLDVHTAPYVDENLFLVNLLADTYRRWEWDASDGKRVVRFIADSRQRLGRLREMITARGLDPAVGGMYDEGLGLLDAYETYLANIGQIKRDAVGQAVADAAHAFVEGTLDGMRKSIEEERAGTATQESEMTAGLAWLGNSIERNRQKSARRDSATERAMAAELQTLSEQMARASASAQRAVAQLTVKYQWTEGEGGFDGFKAKSLNEYAARRPRDPFARLDLAATQVKGEKPQDILNDAKQCTVAVRLVPDGAIYDEYRLRFLREGARLAVVAATAELNGGDYGGGNTPTPSAPQAVQIVRTLLAEGANGADAGAYGRGLLARALACAGRFDDAWRVINEIMQIKGNVPCRGERDFRLMCARVGSLLNDPDAACFHLRAAYFVGFSDVEVVRKSPDFANVRQNRPQLVAELSTVAVKVAFGRGFLTDDVILENKSPFPLTHIVLDVTIIKGGDIWKRHLELPDLFVDESHTFANLFSIPDGTYDEFRWKLKTDQGSP
jgi:hypothetical protein